MRALTGILVVDLVEWLAIAALVAFAVRRRSVALQIAAVIAFLAAVVSPPNASLGAFLGAAGAAGLVAIVVTDPRARRIGLLALGALVVLCLPTAALALSVRDDANAARQRIDNVRDELTSDDTSQAVAHLNQTVVDVDRIRGRLTNVATQPARLVPFVGLQLDAGRRLLGAVDGLVRAAADSVAVVDLQNLSLDGGAVPVERIAQLQQPATRIAAASRAAANDAAEVQRGSLVTPLRKLANQLGDEARDTERSAQLIATFAEQSRALFGIDAPRRYFLLVQNPAEARASGGILGAYAEIAVNQGKLDLAKVGRDSDLNELSGNRPRANVAGFDRYLQLQPKRYWQNFTASPDFPTVARVIEAEYAPIANPVDGVISVDPDALAAMLRIAGPVRVEHWHEPLTADNVVRILQHDQYVRFADDFDLRELFMAEATAAIWKHVTSAELALDRIGDLGKAVAGGHIQLHATRDNEQRFFTDAGIAGEFPDRASVGDVLAVTTQNTGANKTDWFLTRTVTYKPSFDGERFRGTVSVTMRNDAPASGEPPYIIGPNDARVPVGHNTTLVSVYTPWQVDESRIEGSPGVRFNREEFGLRVYSAEVDIPPGGTVTFTLELRGTYVGGADNYSLAYRPQALVKGDTFRVIPVQGVIRQLVTPPVKTNSALRWYGLAS